ncbi:Uncharacterized iron-regulated membrane protein [Fodinibius sediminis]|uniref:Uncharacterized iron-regulated membrane protein n=2 Tax=Fodinibius sediminis TaxID=1214077 RepID=A0A521CNA3_9BACT|nr:Uncharacterized iron-regulated membrane protein [Fodinibius sediminis]
MAGLGLLLLSLTGSILLFQHNIDHAFYEPELESTHETESGVAYDKALATIREAYPHWNIRIHLKPAQASRPLLFDLRRPGKKIHVYTHPATGKILSELSERSSVTMIALKLHYSLMAGLSGRIIVAILGMLFLLSLLTGLYLYRNKLLKMLSFQWTTNKRRRRKKYAFWHNLVGTWSLIFNLLIAITGLYLCYLVVANGFRITGQQEQPNPPAIHASLATVLANVTDSHPGFTPSYIKLPVAPASVITVYGSMQDDFFLFDHYANRLTVHPKRGSLEKRYFMRNQPTTTQLAALMKPLHAGEFGGLAIRILYLLAGLSIPVLSITGYLVNWKR